MLTWTALEQVLHQLKLVFDGLRDDLVALGLMASAAVSLMTSLRKQIGDIRRDKHVGQG